MTHGNYVAAQAGILLLARNIEFGKQWHKKSPGQNLRPGLFKLAYFGGLTFFSGP